MNLYEMFNKPEEPALIRALRDFLPIAVKHLKLDHIPKIKLEKHLKDTHVPTFGRFENNTRKITVVISNRHPVDILRTLAHEMVHYKQELQNQLDQDSWRTGSPDEDEANAEGGVIMRLFNTAHPEYLNDAPVEVQENFADGKKPGRKGLAKRMGVNCKQSVSKLRKIAKNSSGERQRMAHWCANMKAGRNK